MADALRADTGRLPLLTGQPFELLSDQDVTDLASAVRIAAGPGAVICIDTLNAAAAGVDENASEAMSRIIAAAKRLQAETAGLVLLVHHPARTRPGACAAIRLCSPPATW